MQYINKIRNTTMKMLNIDQKWFKSVKTLKGIKSAFSWTFGGAGIIHSRHLWTSQHHKTYTVPQDCWTDEVCGSVRLPLHVNVDVAPYYCPTTAIPINYHHHTIMDTSHDPLTSTCLPAWLSLRHIPTTCPYFNHPANLFIKIRFFFLI